MPHRSPTIFWLLLAATISVDAVAVKIVVSEQNPHFATILHALIISQLDIVCIWSALRTPSTVWSRMAPVGAVVLATFTAGFTGLWTPSFRGWLLYWTYLGYFGLHAAALVTFLWLLQRTNYWQRRTGVQRTWQFSLAHLLIVTTAVAVLVTLIKSNEFIVENAAMNLPELVACLVLALGAAVVWSLSWNWFLRLACVIGMAILLGVAMQVVAFGPYLFAIFEILTIVQAFLLIQAIVLSTWLGLGPILPPAVDDSVAPGDAPRASS